jgi:hypothetical protein
VVTAARGECPVCRYSYRLRAGGAVQRHHGYSGHDPLPDCRGSGMMPLSGDSAGPRRVVVAGDWHGNTGWAIRVVKMAAKLLRDEPVPLILHLGDFGIWPGDAGAKYIADLSNACREHNVAVWFIDGNHEDFTQLGNFRDSDPVRWLPRGTRWQWHGRTWLALGGGVSLDRAIRTEGETWWPQEEITADEIDGILEDGPAHVMITHDVPSGVVHTFPAPPRFWDLKDLARNDAHRERLQRVVSEVRPGWLLHGHLHVAYQRVCDLGYGPVEVTGLDRDEGDGPNYAVLDVRLMRWDETG